MPALDIIADGTIDSGWPVFDPATAVQTQETIKVVGMPRGTVQGNPTVFIIVTLPDGKKVYAETTLRLFALAGKALTAHYETFHGFKV